MILQQQLLKPDLTFLIDISPKKAFERAVEKHTLDRIETKKLSFYNRVRNGFLEVAKKNKKRFVVIDGTKQVGEIHGTIIKAFTGKLSFLRKQESD